MKHHYVPQFYLRQWSAPDGRVLCYRRVATGVVVEKPVSPKSTAFEPGLYAAHSGVEWEGYDEDIIETEVMSPIDNDAAPVLQKLVNGISILSEDERTAWALFLNSLPHRHRDAILERDAVAPKLAEQLRADWLARYAGSPDLGTAAEALEGLNVDQMARTAHRTLMVRAIRLQSAIDAFKKKNWDILAIDPGLPLVTTDRPMLINLGKGGPVQFFTMALSPTRLLVAYPPHWVRADGTKIDGVEDLLKQIAFGHDLMLLNEHPCRYVYSSRKLDDDFAVGDKVLRLRTAVEQSLARWPA